MGWLSKRPPSATQCALVMLMKSAIGGRSGTSLVSGVDFVKGTKEGSNAAGNEAELRAANARAEDLLLSARSSSVNVKTPRRSTSCTRVPNESVNWLVSPLIRVVVT